MRRLNRFLFFFAVAGLELGALHDREVQINDPTANIGVLSGLLPYTKYRIYIFARTKEGRGEPTFIEAWTTPEQGEKIWAGIGRIILR